MFDVITQVKCVSKIAGKPAWLWSVEFRALNEGQWELSHMSEGIAPSLQAAGAEMNAAAERGKEQLQRVGFKIREMTA